MTGLRENISYQKKEICSEIMGEILQMLVLENNFPSLKKKNFLLHDHFHADLSTLYNLQTQLLSFLRPWVMNTKTAVPHGTMEIEKLCFSSKLH